MRALRETALTVPARLDRKRHAAEDACMSAKWSPVGGRAIDECLARAKPKNRTVLQKLRKTIHAAIPAVVECISIACQPSGSRAASSRASR
jgi:hypothetical protein